MFPKDLGPRGRKEGQAYGRNVISSLHMCVPELLTAQRYHISIRVTFCPMCITKQTVDELFSNNVTHKETEFR